MRQLYNVYTALTNPPGSLLSHIPRPAATESRPSFVVERRQDVDIKPIYEPELNEEFRAVAPDLPVNALSGGDNAVTRAAGYRRAER